MGRVRASFGGPVRLHGAGFLRPDAPSVPSVKSVAKLQTKRAGLSEITKDSQMGPRNRLWLEVFGRGGYKTSHDDSSFQESAVCASANRCLDPWHGPGWVAGSDGWRRGAAGRQSVDLR